MSRPEPYIYIYTVYVRFFWQGNHQIYGHIRCVYTVLANPTHTASLCTAYKSHGYHVLLFAKYVQAEKSEGSHAALAADAAASAAASRFQKQAQAASNRVCVCVGCVELLLLLRLGFKSRLKRRLTGCVCACVCWMCRYSLC